MLSSVLRNLAIAAAVIDCCFLLPGRRGAFAQEQSTGMHSHAACLNTMDELMSQTVTGGDHTDSVENKLLCSCQPQSNGEYTLLCSLYDHWSYCGSNEICASVLFGQIIDGDGNVSKRFRNYDQIVGKPTPVSTIIVEEFPGSGDDDRCLAFVDGVPCNRCDVVDCPSGTPADYLLAGYKGASAIFKNKKVDCTNVYTDATFDCGVGQDILSVLNGQPLPNGKTFPPLQTLPPYSSPTVSAPTVAAAPTAVLTVQSTSSASSSLSVFFTTAVFLVLITTYSFYSYS